MDKKSRKRLMGLGLEPEQLNRILQPGKEGADPAESSEHPQNAPESSEAGPPEPTESLRPELALAFEQPGQSIGRYKLLEKIGEGGFGIVYIAQQQSPV